jgi:hypothetical protein
MSIRIFIPTLRKSIFDLIDITQPVKQIKQLRANNSTNSSASSSSSDTEAQLWEEVKLSSFTMLFVSTYVLCGLTTLLKVQLHVLARAILRGEGPALESLGATGDNADDIVMYARDSALLKKFIEGTFRTMFSTGLQRFANDVRQRLQYLLRDWVVKERMRVDFEDMLQLLNTVRRDFESDFDTLMRNLFCGKRCRSLSPPAPPSLACRWAVCVDAVVTTDVSCACLLAFGLETAPEAVYAYHGLGVSDRAPSSSSGRTTWGPGNHNNKKDDPRAERLLTQLRHAIDNPLFSVVYRESADAAFRMVVDNLRRFVFLSSELLTPMASQPTTPVKATNGHAAAIAENGSTHGSSSSSNGSSHGSSGKRPVSTPSHASHSSSAHGHATAATSPVTSSVARRASQANGSPVPPSPPPGPLPSALQRASSASLNSSSSVITKKSPPLASILPQLKSLSARLLPETAEAVNPYDLKSLTSGPLLESFCMTIFDAEDMMRVG